MKVLVTMKDPDTLHDAVYAAVKDAVNHSLVQAQIDEDERDSIVERRTQKTYEACGRWFDHGEYLTVEIDTDAGTCVVVERRP